MTCLDMVVAICEVSCMWQDCLERIEQFLLEGRGYGKTRSEVTDKMFCSQTSNAGEYSSVCEKP